MLGTILLQQRDFAAAEQHVRIAIESRPELASAWANLGITYMRTGRDADARRVLERAALLDPDLTIIHVNLGALAERSGDRDEAVQHYWRAYRLDPAFEGLGDHLADLLAAVGRMDESRLVQRERQQRLTAAPK